MTNDEVKKHLEQWTYDERRYAFKALLEQQVGAVEIDAEKALYAVGVHSERQVHPGCVETLSAIPYIPFQPLRLVICEESFRVTTTETEETREYENVVRKRWFKPDEIVSLPKTLVQTPIVRDYMHFVGPLTWEVHQIYAGQKAQLLNGPKSGNVFGSEHLVKLDGRTMERGLHLSLVVKNVSDEPALFKGVILGKLVDEKPEPTALERLEARVAKLEGAT